MRDFWEIVGVPLVVSSGLTVSLVGFIMAVAVSIDAWSCRGYERATGLKTKFVAATCYVHDNGSWLRYEERMLRNATVGQ